MNVGYGFLLGSEAEIGGADLTQIRQFMCPISGGDTRRCLNCQGLKTCKAGQRVAALLAQRDGQHEKERWQKVLDVPAEKPHSIEDGQRQLLRDACESGNAWNYIMQMHNQSKDAAKETLLQLIRKYPAIAAEYGGSRRIMQRPRVVTTTNIGREPEEEQPKQEEQEPQAVQETTTAKNISAGREAANAARREVALKMYRECLQASDPVAYYVEQRNTNEKAAKLFLARMDAKYGEGRGYEVQGRGKPAKPEETPEAETEAQVEAKEEDSVSLEDFLAQYSEPAEQDAPETAPKGPENAPKDSGGQFIDPDCGAADMAQITRKNACVALKTLNRIMTSGDATHADKIRAAEVMLQFYAQMEKGGTD